MSSSLFELELSIDTIIFTIKLLINHSDYFSVSYIEGEIDRLTESKFFRDLILLNCESYRKIENNILKKNNFKMNSSKFILSKTNYNLIDNNTVILNYNPIEPTKIIIWLDEDNDKYEIIDEPFVLDNVSSLEVYDSYNINNSFDDFVL